MKELVPYVGEKTARERIEELFDRKSTTGFLLGAMLGGLATTLVSAISRGGLPLYSVMTLERVLLWLTGVGLTVFLAVFWEKAASVAEDAVDEVTDDS